eukprot:CAMPEP_0201923830 /NCGR_PEP_ID=MMETSP0903-20130614/12108_1 /ASSEMBLY_ACC=CAM_ASM_000552 /TAXON_ID=420261 /ORGANISM="Thalassiosira antarctica, Strain CCMP982" /LENGTH=63 /DNA_ID=CAMNT_0048461217 /DNA_START=1 /DNA_END=189 /DNA_ORIENTATION=+
MSPENGTPENLEGKFKAEGKKEAVATSPSSPPAVMKKEASPSSHPVTVSVGNFDITVSPKPPN